MWVIAGYQPVGMFSLKSAIATSSGGKSLLTPTPYAVKMALLDAAYRVCGAARVEPLWPIIRDLGVAVDLSDRVVVTNLFTKILKPRRGSPPPGTAHAGVYQKTIAYREYVWPAGVWHLALRAPDQLQAQRIGDLLPHINYVGKRGGFVQLYDLPVLSDELPPSCTYLNCPEGRQSFSSRGVLQLLDDCAPQMTLAHADIYSGKNVRLDKERLLHHVVLPYEQVRSSKSYTLYERLTTSP